MCDSGIDDFKASTTTSSAPGWSAPPRSASPWLVHAERPRELRPDGRR